MAKRKTGPEQLLKPTVRKEQRMGINRGTAEWVLNEIRRYQGDTLRQMAAQKVVLSSAANVYPQAFALVPAVFVGPYTDNFDVDTGLTGPYVYPGGGSPLANPAITADGYLKFSGDRLASTTQAECGRVGGAFLPTDASWAVETAITDLDNSNAYARGSIGVAERSAGDTWTAPWYNVGALEQAVMGVGINQAGTMYMVSWTHGSVASDVVSYTPTRAQPVYLRIEYDHSATTFTFKYKGDAEIAWTTHGSDNVGAGYWTYNMDVFTVIDSPAGAGTFSAEFDYVTVEYAPEAIGDIYAFIPTKSFSGYQKNHLYIRKT